MIKKFILLVFLIICVSLFCCAKFFENKSQQDVVIQFASWGSESEVSILKPVINQFEKENPQIKIDFMHIPQNYFQKIHLLFASNTAPDIVFLNNHYLPIYANAGVLEDLTSLDSVFEYENFYKKAIQALTWNEKIYAVPRDVSNLVIFYNKNIFDKYGVSYPKKDWTIDEFLIMAKKLTHLPDVFGVSFEDEPLFYLPYLASFGVENFKNLDDEKMREGLSFYADIRNKYHVAPYKQESASATMAQMFLQQRIAMHLSGRWLVPKYRQEADFDWDVVEFPRGIYNGNLIDASGWAITKSSKYKAEAMKFVKYLSSQESIKEFSKSGLIVPARIDVANSIVFLDNKSPKSSYVFLEIIEKSRPTPVSVDFKQVLDKLKIKTEQKFNQFDK
ncbi:MAG: sugar ABC transporter substrate-binding protein [Cyanobacteria bacterium SIG26]|nr:sugar ABC transporter substrate-binding protein [Cyanobacteria bacterium SIG26]